MKRIIVEITPIYIKNITRAYNTSLALVFFLIFVMLIRPFDLKSQNQTDSIHITDSSHQYSSQLDSDIKYNAKDSIIINLDVQKAYLYQNAHVDYGEPF